MLQLLQVDLLMSSTKMSLLSFLLKSRSRFGNGDDDDDDDDILLGPVDPI